MDEFTCQVMLTVIKHDSQHDAETRAALLASLRLMDCDTTVKTLSLHHLHHT
jgi:hypothetical protein